MKIKTSELTGIALDWAVTMIEKPEACEYGVEDWRNQRRQTVKNGEYVYRWHQSWAQSGPFIEREDIDLSRAGRGWWAMGASKLPVSGDTPLIAVCRCLVARELGDEVDIPEELI